VSERAGGEHVEIGVGNGNGEEYAMVLVEKGRE
jgi:hypothetical protein